MPRLPTNTFAMMALAAHTPAEQDLNQGENQASAGLADSTATFANTLTGIETAIGSIAAAASTRDGATANLPAQRTSVSNLSDSLTTGVGALVDATMNEAATKLAVLPVQPELGISNSNTKLILKLFEL